MKTISAVVVIALAAVTPFIVSAQTTDPVQVIRQQYTAINRNVAKYRKVKKGLAGFSAEGGELFAYFKGPSIVKITATYFGETGRATEEYYYSSDKLIFVFRKDVRYDQTLSGKVVATTENRFYFKDDKLIRWIGEDGKEVPSTSSEYAPKETEYFASSKQFIDGARSRNRTIEGQ